MKEEMIDIHSHILPGVDDGAQVEEEALTMARIAVTDGTRTMIATPHISTQQELEGAGEIPGKVMALRQAFAEYDIPLELTAGAEVYPMPGIVEALNTGAPLTLDAHRRYLLLDTPISSLPLDLEHLIFSIQMRGITVILAHPERAVPVQANPKILENIVFRGVLLQVNATSLTGLYGNAVEEAALTLLCHRWACFVASDAHGCTGRIPSLKGAVDVLEEEGFTEEEIARLVKGNGQRVLDGEPIPTDPLPYTPPKRKRWFGLFGG